MVKTKTKYLRYARTKRTRLCFTDDIVTAKISKTVSIQKKTPQKNPQKANFIELYPNYPMRMNKVNSVKRLPQDLQVDDQGLKFGSTCCFTTQQLKAQNVESQSPFVIQIHYVRIMKDKPTFTTGTGFLVRYQGEAVIMTCLSIFWPESNEAATEELILITNDDEDASGLIESNVRRYLKTKENDPTFNLDLVDIIKASAKTGPLVGFQVCEAFIDKGFVCFRKEWLQKIESTGEFKKLLDPISSMKPSPALDFCLLTLSKESVDLLLDNGSSFKELTGKISLSAIN